MRFPLCIIPAAGQATRMGALCADGTPKCLLEIRGKPIIQHILDYWEKEAKRFLILASLGRVGLIERAIGEMGEIAQVVPVPKPLSLPQAIAWGHEQYAPETNEFLVVLGDCLVRGVFAFGKLQHPLCAVAVMEGDPDFARSYAVAVHEETETVERVIEKPKMGLGVYALNKALMSCFNRNQGITYAIDNIKQWYDVQAIPFQGTYLNVTYPEDLKRW